MSYMDGDERTPFWSHVTTESCAEKDWNDCQTGTVRKFFFVKVLSGFQSFFSKP